MKHLQNFEGFGLFNSFFHRKKKYGAPLVPELTDVVKEDEVEEIPVRWTGAYNYKGKNIMLEVGDITNKGIITQIINDIHATYITDNGDVITNPEELVVYKGSEEAIKRFLDIKKYNI